MPEIQVSDELQRLIEQQVADGHAETAAAFIEAAVHHAIARRDMAGAANLAMLGTPEDERQVLTGMMDGMLARFNGGRT